MGKARRIEAAKETLEIFKRGLYKKGDRIIHLEELHRYSMENTVLITPDQCNEYVQKYNNNNNNNKECNIRVQNITTIEGIKIFTNESLNNIGILNFASARNPGGGFLNGSLAQEESLAVASGLYYTQLKHKELYEYNRIHRTMMYSDYMIYSKDVVFIRDDTLELIENPLIATVITSPAVNYGQVLLKGEDSNKALEVMKSRIRKILALFIENNNKNIILGAFGCGVFRNDPKLIAEYFKEILIDENYKSHFDNIIFAVYDKSKEELVIESFYRCFLD